MDAFQPISIDDRQIIQSYLWMYRFNEGSECTFTNLLIWGKAEDIRWASLDGCLLLRVGAKSENPRMLMALAPEERLYRAIELAVDSMQSRGEPFQMTSLPGWYVERMETLFPGRFVFTREPHHDDYIYSAESLRTLSGSKLHGKRNHINKFMSLYGERCSYMPYSPEYEGACMRLEENWACAQAGGGALTQALEDEVESVRRALQNAGALGLLGGMILVDGKVVAFTLGERIADSMALIHVEKADVQIPGAYAMINREFIEREFPDVSYVNREEDMGNEGLRRAKRSYCPVKMIEKFGATLRSAGV